MIELTEKIADLTSLYFLHQLSFQDFKPYCKSSCKNDTERKENFDRMKNYVNAMINNDGSMIMKYDYSQYSNDDIGGRIYCGKSIQGLSKPVRGFLMKHTTDIDMKNCHPVLLRYICKQHNIMCPNLEYYITNRDKILNEQGAEYKEKFLRVVNSDKPIGSDKFKFLKDFDKECKNIQKQLTSIPEYKHIVDSVPAHKTYNKLGSAVNRILCVYEDNILQELIKFIQSLGIDIAVLCFDGLMVYGDYYINTKLLKEIEEHIESKFEGLNMKFDYKQHNNEIKMPSDFKIPEREKEVTSDDGVTNDLEAAKKVFELFSYWFLCDGDLYVYDKKTGMYGCSETDHFKVIISLGSHLNVISLDRKGKINITDKNYANDINMMRKIIPIIKTFDGVKNDMWLDEMQETSLGKLLFTNGYYDFKLSKFFPVTDNGFNFPEILFMAKIDHELENFDNEYIDDIKNRFFHVPLGKDVGDYFALNIARGLAGDKMKRILFGLGAKNNGKSLLTKAICNACGKYVANFNGENLSSRNTSDDEAKQYRWAKLLRFKRLIFSNEMRTETKLNGNMIKKISSGGDKIIGRGHGQNEEEFIVAFLAVCFANDLPEMRPYDEALDTRIRIIQFDKEFVDGEPENEFQLKMDKNIESEIHTLEFKKAFIGLLIREYMNYMDNKDTDNEPVKCVIAKQDWTPENKNFINDFANNFDITNDDKDFIESNRIQEWIDGSKLGISMKKFAIEMKKYCVINKLENIGVKVKKINGKSIRVWYGVKLFGNDGESD